MALRAGFTLYISLQPLMTSCRLGTWEVQGLGWELLMATLVACQP